MNCAECALPIEPDGKKMQMPCCDLTYHPQCGIDRLFSGGYYTTVVCMGCANYLHDSPYYSSNSSSNTQDIDAGNALGDNREAGYKEAEGEVKGDVGGA